MKNKMIMFRIGRTRIYITNQEDAAQRVKQLVHVGKKGSIFISSIRTVVIANHYDPIMR